MIISITRDGVEVLSLDALKFVIVWFLNEKINIYNNIWRSGAFSLPEIGGIMGRKIFDQEKRSWNKISLQTEFGVFSVFSP